MKNISLILVAVLFLYSCKNKSKENSDSTTVSNTEKVSKNCLSSLDFTYQELLTIDEITQTLSLDATTVKTKTIDRKDEYGSVYYSWKSDRPDQPNPIYEHVKLPDNNSVGMSSLRAYSEELSNQDIIDVFERSYKQLSDEEIAAIDKNMKKHLADKSQEENEAVEGLVEARKKNPFEKIEGLGQSAFWKFNNQNGGELVVLFGNEKFSIYTKISLDADENLTLAKKLAQMVLNKCRS